MLDLQLGQYAPPEPLEADSFEAVQESLRVQQLKKLIKQVTTTIATSSSPAATLSLRSKLLQLLQDADIPDTESIVDLDPRQSQAAYETELEWLFLGKATIIVYGVTFNTLLQQTLPLSEDIYYWDEILSSNRYTALYSVQIAPLKLLESSKEIYLDALKKFKAHRGIEVPPIDLELRKSESLPELLRKFYSLVKNSLSDRIEHLRKRARMTSPFTIIRHDIRMKQAIIHRLRETQAASLGILVGETLEFDSPEDPKAEWKQVIERAALLIEKIVCNVSSVKFHTVEQFEELIFNQEGEYDLPSPPTTKRCTALLSRQLQKILKTDLPAQEVVTRQTIATYGRPGLLIRYWAPTSILLFSSSKILRTLSHHRAGLHIWVQETVTTLIDFWKNWVIDPVKKILGTIRHNEASEVALMSRRSLTADMKSLERMVVDFALDNPDVASDVPSPVITSEELELIRQHVKEGDLTPVLKVYERDLRNPFKGAIRGELVRALLIQIQKTKVDVEVAISGIDKLLKSQELVFGLVGLTPGLLATWAAMRWLGSIMSGRKGIRKGKVGEEMIRVLRWVLHNPDYHLHSAHGAHG